MVILILSLISKNFTFLIYVAGIIGLVFLLLAGIFSYAFVSGDRMRANQAIESTIDRNQRLKWSAICFLIGLPNLFVAVLTFILSKV
ncbi:DUF5316 domain-containing protein [Aneurinibacillus sp. Ricciae_BoGa-3]|uniref:DUF5316 domain-containing protein n=1 Tax=Aneurinibacillus sp. Ricciae_BoGa-3 TaxID=3022697 RepID=UPI003FA4425E